MSKILSTIGKFAPGALATVPAVIQGGIGIYQMLKGKKQAQSMERPQYQISQEMLDMMTDSEVQALRGLPEEQVQQYMDNVMRSQQASLAAAGDRKAGLAGLASSQQVANDAYKNLLSMDAQARQAAEQRLQGVRGQMNQVKDFQWKTNELDPYLNTMQSAEAMKGAGMQNIMGGVQSGAQMGLDYMKYMKLLNSFGQPNTPGNIPQNPSAGLFNVTDPSDTIGTSGILDANKSYNTAINSAASVLPQINFPT